MFLCDLKTEVLSIFKIRNSFCVLNTFCIRASEILVVVGNDSVDSSKYNLKLNSFNTIKYHDSNEKRERQDNDT